MRVKDGSEKKQTSPGKLVSDLVIIAFGASLSFVAFYFLVLKPNSETGRRAARTSWANRQPQSHLEDVRNVEVAFFAEWNRWARSDELDLFPGTGVTARMIYADEKGFEMVAFHEIGSRGYVITNEDREPREIPLEEAIAMASRAKKGEASPRKDVKKGPPPPEPTPVARDPVFDMSGIERAEGGYSVSELFLSRTELDGREVAVRGVVMKFSPQIMGKNWIHLQDGTSHEGLNDVTITTDDTAQKGDRVLVRGNLKKDKDFGAGYKYDIIVEDAAVTVESASSR